tara:strand:- start:1245 stop:1430 length:186 start_codon:yes stop_codon:yes gene_type:complete
MTLYKCKCGEEKEINKATLVLRNNKWVTKEALCKCNEYMDSKPLEGIPSLKRTEETLRRSK